MTTLVHNKISEGDVISFMNILQYYHSKHCATTEIVLPFLCKYVYPPCYGNNISTVQLISHVQCKDIRDKVCADEWEQVRKISPSLLPVCENFKEGNDLGLDHGNVSRATIKPLKCHYQFKEFCGLCLPLCGKFSQYKVKTKFQERSILIFSGSSAFIGGILVFIAAFIRRKQL